MTTIGKTKDKREKSKERDDKLKKTTNTLSTPKNFIQKSSTLDIYGQKKKTQTTKTSKNTSGVLSSNASPMKDLLKSSPSAASQLSAKSVYEKQPDAKAMLSARKGASRTSVTGTTPRTSVAGSTPRTLMVGTTPKVGTTPRRAVSSARSETKPILDARKLSRDTKPNLTPESSRKISRTPKTNTSITVYSPPVKRKLNMGSDRNEGKSAERGSSKEVDRQRTKTRTLDDNEVKVLTPDVVDNNAEMINLARRLSAKPKAFYVDLEQDKAKNIQPKDKSSDEDYSYEDDFESYESDFESYHSDQTSATEKADSTGSASERDEHSDSDHAQRKDAKDGKDEEKMLDSGSFELRESQRSAKSKPSKMEFILEDSEDLKEDKRSSLTDEGFQEMSSSSTGSSMKTVHVDVLDRPLFIDFSKSKINRRKKRISDQLKQRGQDLLSMITLHEMSYTLFEMKPIPYDLYMATFGRSNYTQIAVQTFDDGVTEEIQTEEILCDSKWTQHPVKFSNSDVYLKPEKVERKYANNDEDCIAKLSSLLNTNLDVSENNKINTDKDFVLNPLRIYFEQKDGAGCCEMLSYEKYKSKIKSTDYNPSRLCKFLKRVESRVCNVLNINAGSIDSSGLVTSTKFPFSKGYVSINTKNIDNDDFSFIKDTKIRNLIFSETKPNLIMTVHGKIQNGALAGKSIVCLWNTNVARGEPVKILVAIDNVAIGRFRGDTDGIFVAALEDGSLHLWDLSEEAAWRGDVATTENSTELVEVESKNTMTQTQKDREWNFRNSKVGVKQVVLYSHPYTVKYYVPVTDDSESTDSHISHSQTPPRQPLQASAYTSSAMTEDSAPASGLRILDATVRDGGRKVVGQVCVLQQIGVLTIWSIVQEKKTTSYDIGKAFWSRMKLEKAQVIRLLDHFDTSNVLESENVINFNLTAAKRRISSRKQEKTLIKRQKSRPKSAVSSDFDLDSSRPASGASAKKVLPAENNVPQNWESGMVCNDLSVLKWENVDYYLVAKNCGEVLCCTKNAGAVRVQCFKVTTDTSSITCLGCHASCAPLFLAASDAGAVHLCSLAGRRVLLTLDCRNVSPTETIDKCQSDHKGRFVSSAKVRSPSHAHGESRTGDASPSVPVLSVHWSPCNPCLVHCVQRGGSARGWDLARSDISARAYSGAEVGADGRGALAILTSTNEVQIHRLSDDLPGEHYQQLFKKYVALL